MTKVKPGFVLQKRTVNRSTMHQRVPDLAMEVGTEKQSMPVHPRGRNNSKPKVLVRSHAMRESTSPPREPTPTMLSPCIKLTPSPTGSPNNNNNNNNNPVVVLSPSMSRGSSPCRSNACISPTSTLVPSPTNRCSPINMEQYVPANSDLSDSVEVSPVRNYSKNKNDRNRCAQDAKVYKEVIMEETYACDGGRRNKSESKCRCEIALQNCSRCLRGHDRNYGGSCANLNSPNMLSVNSSRNVRGKLRHQSSSQGSFEGSSSNSPCLSRDSSSEQYTDTTGVDLEVFIPDTINRNAKDRALLLRIEQELVAFAKDSSRVMYKFPPMSSYQRMCVHRCAAYFGMDHNVELSGKCVVVTRTKNTRIPEIEFKSHIRDDIVFNDEPQRRSILKRDSAEDYGFKSPDRQFSFENRRSKSFEEREEEYEKVRRRIFNREMHDASESTEDLPWSDVPWSSTESECSNRLKLLPPDLHGRSGGRLLKVHSEEVGEETMRPHVAKSYSFGGYGGSVLTRGDSCMSTHSAGPRLLTKQDSGASSVSWRLSPSSSGYKTQSQRSESITPSPTSTPHLSGDSIRQDSTNSIATNVSDIPSSQADEQPEQLVWAVTDINSVPKGSIIINPKTLEPVKNQDGTIYHYDPSNPPQQLAGSNSGKPPPSPQKTQQQQQSPVKSLKERPPSPKRRTRASPVKKAHTTNSSTSPSLPFTPPNNTQRSYTFTQSSENISNIPLQQYPMYGQANFAPPPPEGVVYQQPCIVYTAPPYGVPITYDNRLEPQIPEMQGYYIGDNTNSSQLTYQQPAPIWNQQPMYYQNSTPAGPQRYSVPLPNQSFMSASYPSYLPPQNPIPQTPPSSEMVYPPPVQVMYPQNQTMYPNQGIIYTQNPVYQSPSFPPQIPYPQCTSAASSCTSSVSNAGFPPQMQEQPLPQSFTQNMAQLSISHNSPGFNSNFNQNKTGGYGMGGYKSNNTNGKKLNNNNNHFKNLGSSQSSTGTNSPATTVIASFNPGPGLYRTPPETPPTQQMSAAFPPNFMPPILMRQMSGIHASPPVTNRSSRSPTPASDISHVERHRMPLPPNVYQGLPYVLQPDPRLISGRGPPHAYNRPPPIHRQSSLNEGNNGKGHKNRKTRGNKSANLPPNGKSV